MSDHSDRIARLMATSRRAHLELADPERQPSATELAEAQTEDALRMNDRDLSGCPRWTWPALDALVGPMLPGDLWVVGGLYANGKTSFLLSQLDALAAANVPVLYLPLEVAPPALRRRWAAWACGLDWVHVSQNAWYKLPPNAHREHNAMIARQAGLPVQFPEDRRMTVPVLARWIDWGLREFSPRIVIIDHFHRLDFGNDAQYRVAVTEAVRAIKDLAVKHNLVILAAAQLNHNEAELLDRYQPPQLRRLKESAGLAEEPDAVLLLSRRLKKPVTKAEIRLIKMGHLSDRDFAEPGAMVVTCRKHRTRDAIAGDRSIVLHVGLGGRVTDAEL